MCVCKCVCVCACADCIHSDGTTKTVWTNFPVLCKKLHRSLDHVLEYTLAELGTNGSIDGMTLPHDWRLSQLLLFCVSGPLFMFVRVSKLTRFHVVRIAAFDDSRALPGQAS